MVPESQVDPEGVCLQVRGMWGKLEALRDYHTASEERGELSTHLCWLRFPYTTQPFFIDL